MTIALRQSVIVAEGLRLHTINKVAHSSLNIIMRGIEKRRTSPYEKSKDYRFMVVRHPLDRLVSSWHFFCKGGAPKDLVSPIHDLGYKRGLTWTDFLELVKKDKDCNIHITDQYKFAGDKKIDMLTPIERLDEHWEILRTKFTYLPEMIHENPTDHKEWWWYYTDKERAEMEELFMTDKVLYSVACRTHPSEEDK